MREDQLAYLYAAISDAQSLINFIDTKTAGGITIMGLFLASIFGMLEDLLSYAYWFSLFHWISLGLTLLCLFLCLIVVARILKPTINPEANISKEDAPSLKFFLAQNKYDHGKIGKFIYPYYNSSEFKLAESLISYTTSLTKAKSEEIGKSLAFELLKLNFIRNIKNDRFHFLFKLLIVTTVFFMAFIVCHTKEMILIKDLIDAKSIH